MKREALLVGKQFQRYTFNVMRFEELQLTFVDNFYIHIHIHIFSVD